MREIEAERKRREREEAKRQKDSGRGRRRAVGRLPAGTSRSPLSGPQAGPAARRQDRRPGPAGARRRRRRWQDLVAADDRRRRRQAVHAGRPQARLHVRASASPATASSSPRASPPAPASTRPPACSVAVAFDAGNLEPVARAIRAKWPKVAAGDRGRRRLRDQRAADRQSGPALRPQGGRGRRRDVSRCRCSSEPDGQTDFNDLAVAEGSEAVAAIILRAFPEPDAEADDPSRIHRGSRPAPGRAAAGRLGSSGSATPSTS